MTTSIQSDTETDDALAPNQPKLSRLRKLQLTINIEYLMPDGQDIGVLKDRLESLAEQVVTSESLTDGTNAEVDIKAFGIREIGL